MPAFDAFPATRYAPGSDLQNLLAPPYDVVSEAEVAELHARDPHNITHIDVPGEPVAAVEGAIDDDAPADADRYARAGRLLDEWIDDGVLVTDDVPALTIERMTFTDATGRQRTISGVLGALAVVDAGAGGVLPHERTTPKASTDRLDLTRATGANLSPVWGLSLASGLTALLAEPGELIGEVELAGAVHRAERITDPERIAAISAVIASDDVLIADGHHRYGVARQYRDEVRAATGRDDTAAEATLAFVNELIDEQLSIEAIHRIYSGVTAEALRAALGERFTFEAAPEPSPALLAAMEEKSALVVMWPDGAQEWLIPKPGAFDDVRALDGAWLEAATAGLDGLATTYQHGLDEMVGIVASGDVTAGVLIRPTSIEEIRRTAREGLLMPPKSTFFTPKLLTGWVVRKMS